MAKKKRSTAQRRGAPPVPEKPKKNEKQAESPADSSGFKATREVIESIAIACVLAFLVRTFEAEAFTIPTGSMAPGLMGQHIDIECPQCGHWYQTNASPQPDGIGRPMDLVGTTCPLCRYTHKLDETDSHQRPFAGDQLIVSKFEYLIGDPERWDVFVFKNPNNHKQFYIKRLVGLPNEQIKIRHGDIYVKQAGDDSFQIARRPPSKVNAMFHLVHDTHHVPRKLAEAGWPSRWRPVDENAWNIQAEEEDDSAVLIRRYAVSPADDQQHWLRYWHFVPYYDIQRPDARHGVWNDVDTIGRVRDELIRPSLISDFHGYNAAVLETRLAPNTLFRAATKEMGMHWVGDLAVECRAEIESDSGELLLDLIEGGRRFACRIDVATGQATVGIDDESVSFDAGDDNAAAQSRSAETSLQGPGTYDIRFANVDDELLLWVNGSLISFDGPTTFESRGQLRPHWSTDDPGDLSPAGVGVKETKAVFSRLKIYRDIYYIADTTRGGYVSDYDMAELSSDEAIDPQLQDPVVRAQAGWFPQRIQQIFRSPQLWTETKLFSARREISFELEEGQFLPLGDNSPSSLDARLWQAAPYVERINLKGKALFIYWPHPWRKPIPFFPNFSEMGFVR